MNISSIASLFRFNHLWISRNCLLRLSSPHGQKKETIFIGIIEEVVIVVFKKLYDSFLST
jgi:hypothetical protein